MRNGLCAQRVSRGGEVCATGCARGGHVRNALCAGGRGLCLAGGMCTRACAGGVRATACAREGGGVCATGCARGGGAGGVQRLVRQGGCATACAWQGACAAKEVTHEL